MMSENAFAFMAFGKAQETTDGARTSRYTGVGSVRVLAVNPSKEKLAEIYGRAIERDVEYVSDVTDSTGRLNKRVRIEFIVRTDPERNNGIDILGSLSFHLENRYKINGAGDKVQVIDKYGNTAWVTNEEYKVHGIPVYSNGPVVLDGDYRPCYVGEEELTNFLKNYLNIPSSARREGSRFVLNPNPDAECRLDCIEEYFKGNYSELVGALALRPDNKVKVLFGVRTTTDSKGNPRQYQYVYPRMTLRNYVTDYSKLDKEIQGRKASGSLQSVEFFIGDLQEYKVLPTDLSTPKETAGNPFAGGMPEDPFATKTPGPVGNPFAGGPADDPFAMGMDTPWDDGM